MSQWIEWKRGKDKFHQLVVECTDGNVNFVDFKEAKNILERLEFTLKAKSLKKRKLNETDTSFLGEINGQRCIEKRHKTWNEK